MVVIHIQEVTSTQVTEIIAETLEDALFAYAIMLAIDGRHSLKQLLNTTTKVTQSKRWCSYSTMNNSPFTMYMGSGLPQNGNKRGLLSPLFFFVHFDE